MQESMRDAIGAEPDFHLCNSPEVTQSRKFKV